MKNRDHTSRASLGLAAVALAALIGFASSGCEENPSADGSFAGEAVVTGAGAGEGVGQGGFIAALTIEEIDARVALTQEQREPMQTALSQAQAELKERCPRPGDRRGGRGPAGDRPHCPPGGPPDGPPPFEQDGEPPMHTFLAASAELLTLEQFTGLVELLGEERNEMMAERQDAEGPRGGGPRWGGRRGAGPGRGECPGDGPGPGFEQFGDRIAEELDLTDAQREQAQEILQARFEEARAIHEQVRSGSLAREQARDRIREIHEAGREQVGALLTEEQRQKWQALHQERFEERIDAQIERLDDRLTQRAAFLEKVLELDAEQASQVRELFAASIATRKEVLGQLKAGTLRHEDAATQSRLSEEKLADSIAALLTPEQRAAYEALRGLMPHGGRGPR